MKVFVSGCFDLFHSGHVNFLEKASALGELYVGIGSDKTIRMLKRNTVYNENERLFIVQSLRCVKKAFINTGLGMIDFIKELRKVKPDIFFVDEDGHSVEKEVICRDMGIKYVVGKRRKIKGIPQDRSTTNTIKQIKDDTI